MLRHLAVLVASLWATAALADANPCAILTEADVRSVLGDGPWRVWQDLSSAEVCAFQRSPEAIVTLTLDSDPMGADKILEVRRQIAGDRATPAPGPGEGAYRVATPSGQALVFGAGDTVAQVEVSNGASGDPAVVDRLAQAVYARLAR